MDLFKSSIETTFPVSIDASSGLSCPFRIRNFIFRPFLPKAKHIVSKKANFVKVRNVVKSRDDFE